MPLFEKEGSMKTLELRVSVSDERVLTVKLPDDVMPGYHSVVLVIDEPGSAAPALPALFNPAGILEELGIKLTLADFEATGESYGAHRRITKLTVLHRPTSWIVPGSNLSRLAERTNEFRRGRHPRRCLVADRPAVPVHHGAVAMENAIAAGFPVLVSSVSIVEIIYLVERQRLPATLPLQNHRRVSTPVVRACVGPLHPGNGRSDCQDARAIVPDMPDRMIAATAFT